jgi:dTDP-4-dehydrorhamnose 3,5-epimerase
MINGVKIKKLQEFHDDRGFLAEIFRQDEDNYRPQMAYMSITNPQVVRGPHEHERQSDGFAFFGPGKFRLYLWDRREDSSTKGEKIEIEVGEGNPVFVIVPPGVVHGYKCISEIPALSVNLPDKLYKGENKSEEIDEIRWEEDKNSPYQIN